MSSSSANDKPAWTDDHDDEQDLPEFMKESAVTPSWAQVEDETKEVPATRKRDRDLDDILTSSAPLLTSIHQAKLKVAPSILSTFKVSGVAMSVQWHPNGRLAVVGAGTSAQVFHSSGQHTERVAEYQVSAKGERDRPVQELVVGPSGEDVAARTQQTYFPSLVNLTTGQVLGLKFLDMREASPHRHAQMTMAARGKRFDDFYTHLTRPSAMPTTHGSFIGPDAIAVAAGRSITMGALATGSITHKITTKDEVKAFRFNNANPDELFVASKTKVVVYDVRRTAEAVREIVDKGTVDISSMALGPKGSVLTGTESGIVNLFERGVTKQPTRVFKNLSTNISGGAFNDDATLVTFWSKDQKNGIRLAVRQAATDDWVVSAFPPATSRHTFIHSVAFCAQQSLLSLGESGKVTNYAL